jgi:hypothetical protein
VAQWVTLAKDCHNQGIIAQPVVLPRGVIREGAQPQSFIVVGLKL